MCEYTRDIDSNGYRRLTVHKDCKNPNCPISWENKDRRERGKKGVGVDK